MQRDPWAVLDTVPGASERDIHAAWRRQVSRWHPDRNPSPEATRRLQEINDAYRAVYHAAPATCVLHAAAAAPVLAGLSGTVFGHACATAAETIAGDGVWACVELPWQAWLADHPITLGLPVVDGVGTIVTFLHPARLASGARVVFPRSALSAAGVPTDLVVEVRVAAPVLDAAPPRLSASA